MIKKNYRIPDGKPPRFPKKPTIRQEGDILIMECILEAHPVPDITWYQGLKTIADSSRIKMFRRSTGKDTYLLTLEISNPTKADGGNYRCNAFNNFGESNANISLNFQGKSTTVFVGLSLSLSLSFRPFFSDFYFTPFNFWFWSKFLSLFIFFIFFYSPFLLFLLLPLYLFFPLNFVSVFYFSLFIFCLFIFPLFPLFKFLLTFFHLITIFFRICSQKI